ncbi:LysM peptidoglycan-binding domain-containing protein [Fervidibacillus albus]|uniref:LysM peptidoglycan-binding domain-containing protein n=1 Tax=Fervidibacillus albus TaxID=2980026 RepID=A0A9E8LVS5_9BACI|nr:LysM peptidoglycan-binding domain-containing protein [Fervidibacillus albus]WAA10235.1 LysM peptidoglycan-binding domain-containing protein [Fervidibacillus albus]
MANTNKPMTLKFSFEEMVWFRKGDEIQELINLSLEPNVTIQEMNHIISIQGSLDLQGEYKSCDEPNNQEETLSFTGQKFANVLETREAGICEFSYHFPVDITIPKTRVKAIDEIDLQIDMFDYRMLEKNCLQVTTDLLITGVYNEIPDDDQGEERDTDEKWSDEFAENEQYYNNFDVDHSLSPFQELEDQHSDLQVQATKREIDDENKDIHENIPIQIFQNTTDEIEEFNFDSTDEGKKTFSEQKREDHNDSADDVDEGEVVTDTVEAKEESPKEQVEETNDFHHREDVEPSNEEEKQRTIAQNEEQLEADEEEKKTEQVVSTGGEVSLGDLEQFWREEVARESPMAVRSKDEPDALDEQNTSDSAERLEERDDSDESDREEKNIHYQSQEKEEGVEQPISLTEYFARKEESKSARMTVYIVQADDQLDDIAEKYNVQISQLLRINRLDAHHEVYEGQVLLIPKSFKMTTSIE